MSGIPYRPLVFTPVKSKPIQHEWSQYHTQRDSHSPLKQWKDSSGYAQQINALTQIVVSLGKSLSKIKQPVAASFDFHPFKIYNVPDIFRPTVATGSFNPTDNWRTFRVRNGEVLTKTITSGSVYGTDATQYVDSNIFPLNSFDTLVPTGSSRYYFWIETLDTAAPPTGSYVIQSGIDPSQVGLQNKWSNWPSASANHLPIGYVDTLSSGSINQAFVRQYIRSDILSNAVNYQSMSVCVGGQEQTWYVAAYQSGSSP